ncbi:MAG TPA: metallophosphatase [Capsulimonadaceae bacterium]|nr:metallophosphatase [Capsulimonadaceae bacterium]
MSRTIQILHTNDFHNNLKGARVDALAKLKASLGPDLLFLDAGDAISAGNVGVRLTGEPILDTMSELGYDALTMGNREFHVAENCLRLKINRAKFPVLCANMRRKGESGAVLPVQPHFTKILPNGLKVGVFGLTVPMVTEKMAARVVSAFLFDDPIKTANRQIEELRPQVDILIALTHIGIREDERLAGSCPQIDLIIGGHSHVLLTEPARQFGSPIVQAGWFAQYAGVTEVEVPSSGRPVVTRSTLHKLT